MWVRNALGEYKSLITHPFDNKYDFHFWEIIYNKLKIHDYTPYDFDFGKNISNLPVLFYLLPFKMPQIIFQ